MRDINAEDHTTFIFSTHDNRVMDRAGRIIRIMDGVIAASDTRVGVQTAAQPPAGAS